MVPSGDGGLSHQETVAWCHQCQPGTLIGFNQGAPAGEISLREMSTPGPLGDARVISGNTDNEAKHRGYLLAEFTYPILPVTRGRGHVVLLVTQARQSLPARRKAL